MLGDAYTPTAMKNTAIYPTSVVLAVMAMMYPVQTPVGALLS